MLNNPNSWVWFAHKPQAQPHPPKAIETTLPIQQAPPLTQGLQPTPGPSHTQEPPSSQGPPATQEARTSLLCHIDGCGKLLPDITTVLKHALGHLRLVRPWTSELIDANQLSCNEREQLTGCCEACGEVFAPRRYFPEHFSGTGTNQCRRRTDAIMTPAALYAKCCALRDEAERSVGTVCIRSAVHPTITVSYAHYSGGVPVSSTEWAYVLARVDAAPPEETPGSGGAAAPAAIYLPVPITDVFGTLGRLKAAYLVQQEQGQADLPPPPPSSPSPSPVAQQSGSPPSSDEVQSDRPALEILLTSPLPSWYRDAAEAVERDETQAEENQSEGSESYSDTSSHDDDQSHHWSESEGEDKLDLRRVSTPS